MQPSPIFSCFDHKSILNDLGSNALILNENGIIEMVGNGILKLFRKTENEVIGKKCYVILNKNIRECKQCGIIRKKDINNTKYERSQSINKKKYLAKCILAIEEKNKFLIVFEKEKIKFLSRKNFNQKLQIKPFVKNGLSKKTGYESIIGEYGVFLKIFKEMYTGLAVFKKSEKAGYLLSTYNDKFKENFNVEKSNIFHELFPGFQQNWLRENISKPFYDGYKCYEGYYYKPGEKYFNLYFKSISSDLIILTVIDSSENVRIQREMVNSIYDSTESERARIARDLHDGLGSLLSAISMRMNVLKTGRLSADKRQNVIENTSDLVNMVLNVIREVVHNIHPDMKKNNDFHIAVNSFIDKIKKAGDIEISFDDKQFKASLNEKQETHLFKIICELINNTLKHSQAGLIKIRLISNTKHIYLHYHDNGSGFNPDNIKNSINMDKNKNMGIKNIFYRIKDLNGACKFMSEPGKGMEFKMVI